MAARAAALAGKPGSIAVLVRAVEALRAGLARVGRRNKDDLHACQPGLVEDERLKLTIRPTHLLVSQALENPILRAIFQRGQILQNDLRVRALSVFHDTPGELVVDVADRSGLFLPDSFDSSAAGFCVAMLQTSANRRVMLSDGPGVIAIMTVVFLAIVPGGQGANAQIHSQAVLWFLLMPFRNFQGLQQEPLLTISFEIGLPLDIRKKRLAFLSDLKGKLYPATYSR